MRLALICCLGVGLLAGEATAALAFDLADPFGDLDAVPPDATPGCASGLPDRPLALPDVVDAALCRHPRTAAAWAAARSAAAAVGSARSAYLPALSVDGTATKTLSGQTGSGSGDDGLDGGGGSERSGPDTRYTATAVLSVLLFDFGGRRAALDGARAQLEAALATRNDSLQRVYLDAVVAYYDWVSAEEALGAARQSEQAARSSLDASIVREQAGSATRADRLQAQTAFAQSQLARVRSEGAQRTARGSLANAMGLPANRALRLAAAPVTSPESDYLAQVDPLVREALEARPDLAAAAARLEAAQADLRATRAAGLPSLGANATQRHTSTGDSDRDSNSIGLSISVPLFTGFEDSYRVRAAEARLEGLNADLEQLRNAATLEVFQAHGELTTQTQSVFSAQALVAAADESEIVARARYEAGVGTILDLINAQSSAADARRELVLARSNWAAARTQLARAVGVMDLRAPQAQARP